MSQKPFEAPVIKDEVSLVEGTLASGSDTGGYDLTAGQSS